MARRRDAADRAARRLRLGAARAGAEIRRVSARDLYKLYKTPCQLAIYSTMPCGGPKTVDHIVPTGRGGRHSIGNLLAACGNHNSGKNGRLLVEFRHPLQVIGRRAQAIRAIVEEPDPRIAFHTEDTAVTGPAGRNSGTRATGMVVIKLTRAIEGVAAGSTKATLGH